MVPWVSLAALLGAAPGLAAISPDGRFLLAWAEPGRVGQRAALVDVRARRLLARLPDARPWTAAFAPGGIVTSGSEGVLFRPLSREGDVGAARVVMAPPCRDAAVSRDGSRVVAVLDASGEIVVAELASGRVVSRFLPSTLPFTVALDDAGAVVAAGSWHGARGACHDASDGRLLFQPSARSSLAVGFSPVDGALVADGGDELRLLDPRTGATRAALPLGGGSDVPLRASVAIDARLLATADRRRPGAVRLLDATTLRDLAVLELPRLASEAVIWCVLDDAGRTLVAGTVSGRTVTWDLAALRGGLREHGLDW